jgi:hypothetical protein
VLYAAAAMLRHPTRRRARPSTERTAEGTGTCGRSEVITPDTGIEVPADADVDQVEPRRSNSKPAWRGRYFWVQGDRGPPGVQAGAARQCALGNPGRAGYDRCSEVLRDLLGGDHGR